MLKMQGSRDGHVDQSGRTPGLLTISVAWVMRYHIVGGQDVWSEEFLFSSLSADTGMQKAPSEVSFGRP